MLPQNIRLKLRDNQQIFTNSKRKYGKYFVVYFQPDEKTSFAVIASKKNFLKATLRNAQKRRVRGLIINNLSSSFSSIETGKYVIILKSSVKTADLKDLLKDLVSIL